MYVYTPALEDSADTVFMVWILVYSHLQLVLQNCLLFALSLTNIMCVYLIFTFLHRSLSF